MSELMKTVIFQGPFSGKHFLNTKGTEWYFSLCEFIALFVYNRFFFTVIYFYIFSDRVMNIFEAPSVKIFF